MESQLKGSYKEEACSQNAIAYQEGNEEKLKELFINQIVPFSKKGYTDFPSPSLAQPTVSDEFSQQARILVTQLKEIPNVWKQIQNNPNFLLEARSIIATENLALSPQSYRQNL